MKILMITDTLRAGGKERRIVELLKGLSQETSTICQLIVLSKEISYKEVHGLPITLHTLERKSRWDPSLFFKIYRVCRKFRPDIIQSWESMTSIYSLPIAKLTGAKFVNSFITHAPNKIPGLSKRGIRSRATFPFSNAIVANSKAGLKSYNAPTNKSYCIYNGFDFARIKRLRDPQDVRLSLGIKGSVVIGMVGAFTQKKDYSTFLKSAQMLLAQYPDISFLCVGDGPLLESVKSSVSKKYQNNIIFTGLQEDVESIVNAFTIGVLSTFTEGISNAIMEYMALSKPVVATDGGGTKEIVIDGKTGFLIDQISPRQMAMKLKILIDNPALAEEMGANGALRIFEEFNQVQMIQNYLTLYLKLTSSS